MLRWVAKTLFAALTAMNQSKCMLVEYKLPKKER
jgi:hypothetical protein